MKKALALIIFALCIGATGGQVGLPTEYLAITEVEGSYLVCIWDQTSGDWLQDFEVYDNSGVYEFEVPQWGRWYWIGLWDEANGEYVYGKWIGHFLTD
jgi:hypothetical protein